jgi:hypothetical protein
MRSRGHQQQVPCVLSEYFCEIEALGTFHFPAEKVGREFMGFVEYHQVP